MPTNVLAELAILVLLYLIGVSIRYGVGPSRRRPQFWLQCVANFVMLLIVLLTMSSLFRLSVDALNTGHYQSLLVVALMTVQYGILYNEYFDRYILSLLGAGEGDGR